jgi:hypothetical protein
MTAEWKIVGPDGREYERLDAGEAVYYDDEWQVLYVRPKRKQASCPLCCSPLRCKACGGMVVE